jgi:hypothetical protein
VGTFVMENICMKTLKEYSKHKGVSLKATANEVVTTRNALYTLKAEFNAKPYSRYFDDVKTVKWA